MIMTEQKFVIAGGGDWDVGIPSSFVEVTFNGNATWNEDAINDMKSILKEWDDNGAYIYTEKEYDDMVQAELEQMREFEVDEAKLSNGSLSKM